MFGACFYRTLPYFYALINVLELLVAIVLIVQISVGWTSFIGSQAAATTTAIPLPTDVLIKLIVAYGIAFAGSIVPIFTGIILLLSSFICCICLISKKTRRPFLRFITSNCNCPCYIPRPKWRFTIRIGFHLICILLRTTGVIMYGIIVNQVGASSGRSILQGMLTITASSLVFPCLTILLDLYHYRVWWAYKPDVNVSQDIIKKPLSPKHKRFIPYVLIEQFRTAALGNRKCKYGDHCRGRELEHVVIFHSSKYLPQPRWSKEYPTYIGFHRTTPQAAIAIAKSDFKPSSKGMLGPGAYFARSIGATLGKIGKSAQTGAWFIAEISMGNVFQVDLQSIRPDPNNRHFDSDLQQFVKNGKWHGKYDTCYFNHTTDALDEFCIKDPAKQILRWVVVIEAPHDRKLSSYGLDTEFNSNQCGCC